MSSYKFKVLSKTKLHPIVKKMWIFTAIIIFFLVAMLFLPWEQTVKGYGKVIAYNPTQRDYKIGATMDGFIKEFNVKETQFVTKGTPLFTIIDIDKNYLKRLQKIIKSTQEKYQSLLLKSKNIEKRKNNLKTLIIIEKRRYKERYMQINKKIQRFKFKKISLKKHNKIEVANLQRAKKLYKEGIESKRGLEKKENIVINTSIKIKKIEVDIEIEKKSVAILKQEEASFLKKSENSINLLENLKIDTSNALQSLSQEIQRQKSAIQRYKKGVVVAQKDGYILRILQNDQDQFIKKGDPIIHFSPKVTVKSILLKLSDFNMPLVKKGLTARVMFYGWPSLYVTGWPIIKHGTFGGVIKKIEPISHEDGYYYAHIIQTPKEEPWPNNELLKIGSRATVWIRLNSVPIWYQLWRLMNAMPPQMSTPILNKELESITSPNP